MIDKFTISVPGALLAAIVAALAAAGGRFNTWLRAGIFSAVLLTKRHDDVLSMEQFDLRKFQSPTLHHVLPEAIRNLRSDHQTVAALRITSGREKTRDRAETGVHGDAENPRRKKTERFCGYDRRDLVTVWEDGHPHTHALRPPSPLPGEDMLPMRVIREWPLLPEWLVEHDPYQELLSEDERVFSHFRKPLYRALAVGKCAWSDLFLANDDSYERDDTRASLFGRSAFVDHPILGMRWGLIRRAVAIYKHFREMPEGPREQLGLLQHLYISRMDRHNDRVKMVCYAAEKKLTTREVKMMTDAIAHARQKKIPLAAVFPEFVMRRAAWAPDVQKAKARKSRETRPAIPWRSIAEEIGLGPQLRALEFMIGPRAGYTPAMA
ncbi:MAG: hypothetical protein GMKNLPBB_00483 [Myxococcota bacterium]|nr:hypothetical protein [Myxococcota bacterium]